MTFEYRDSYGRVLTVAHGVDDDDNPVAVLWARGEYGVSVPVRIPAGRVEEVVAGIRDAARTAAARQTTGQDDTDRYDARLAASMTAEAATALRDRIETDTVARRAVGQSAEAHDTDQAAARVNAWIASEPVTARSEFGNGYREALRDIVDVINGRQTVEDER